MSNSRQDYQHQHPLKSLSNSDVLRINFNLLISFIAMSMMGPCYDTHLAISISIIFQAQPSDKPEKKNSVTPNPVAFLPIDVCT
jgi:hypothetical protein